MEGRVCSVCGSKTTRIESHTGKSYQRWHNIDGKCHCWKCWKRIIQYHRYDKIWDKKNRHDISLHFLGKKRRVKHSKKTGYCSWCPNNIHDGTCKRTSKHHYFYMPIMIWACTEEICNSCHINETRRIWKKKGLSGGLR